MRFIPGSHNRGQLEHEDRRDEHNILHRSRHVAGEMDASGAVNIELRPGEASLHHGWVILGSNPNNFDERRIRLTMQFMSPSVRQRHTDRESATLVRGVDPFRHFRPEPECMDDFSQDNLAFQREVDRLKHTVYDTDS